MSSSACTDHSSARRLLPCEASEDKTCIEARPIRSCSDDEGASVRGYWSGWGALLHDRDRCLSTSKVVLGRLTIGNTTKE